jgi:hypothetical protein
MRSKATSLSTARQIISRAQVAGRFGVMRGTVSLHEETKVINKHSTSNRNTPSFPRLTSTTIGLRLYESQPVSTFSLSVPV